METLKEGGEGQMGAKAIKAANTGSHRAGVGGCCTDTPLTLGLPPAWLSRTLAGGTPCTNKRYFREQEVNTVGSQVQ